MAGGGKFEAKSLVGLKLDQFEIKSEIARGGMGVVYKGYQPSLDRWVAIKTLPMDLAGDRELVSRFQREAKAMAALNHNNIVQCIHSGEAAGQYYIAMEYVEGPSVKDLLKSPTIETDKIFDILVQTCDGLEYAHKKNLVHRDIKPANLLYEEKTGCVKIADFGIAHFSKKDEDMLTLTADNVGMGTMNYMAPEQKMNAKGVDHRADIYALGVIIYEAFTGKLPLGKFKLPSEVNPKLPRALDEIVTKCLSADAADRYAACSLVKGALLDAKAATHDKSIARSIREAIDRTLTNVSPNPTVRLALAGCFLLGVLGFMGAIVGYALWQRAKGKTRDALVQEVAKLKAAALPAEGTKGEAEIKLHEGEAAEKAYTGTKDLDEQIGQLRKAVEAYEAAGKALAKTTQAGADEAKKALDELAKRLDAASGDVKGLDDDGFKQAGEKALDDAKKALDAKDAVGLGVALDKATTQVSLSKQVAANVKKLTEAAARLPADKQADAKKVLDAVLEARKKGDRDAVNAAIGQADADLAKLGEKPVETTTIKTPDHSPTNPTNTNPSSARDERRIQARMDDVVVAHKTAMDVCNRVSLKILETVGADEMKQASALENEAADAKTTDEALSKLEDARKKYNAAAEAASATLHKRVADGKAAAALAEKYAPDEWRKATDFEAIAGRNEKGSLAEVQALLEALTAFGDAATKADTAANAELDRKKAELDAARKRATARVGEGDKALAAGIDAQTKADGVRAKRDVPATLAAYEAAIKAYDAADRPLPSGVEDIKFRKTTTLDGTFKEGELDAIAPCSRGVVVASGATLKCFSSDFKVASEGASDLLPKGVRVSGLCAGDDDDVYVALGADQKVIRCKVGAREISFDKTVAEKISGGIFGVGYDARRRQLAIALKDDKAVQLVNADSGEKTDRISLANAGGFPRQLSFLRDGSLVVVVQKDQAPGTPESDWTFTLLQFQQSDGKWSQAARRDGDVCATTAIAGGLVGVDHRDKGTLVIWRSGAIDGAPVTLLADATPAISKPTWAMQIAFSGKQLWVLDTQPEKSNLLARRNRLVRYDVKD